MARQAKPSDDQPRRAGKRAARRAAAEGAPKKRNLKDRTENLPVVTDPTDPKSTPSSAGGWSETIHAVANALIVPTAGKDMVQAGGVFDADRHYVDQAVHWRRGRPLLVAPRARRVPEVAADHLAGRWMWGGILLNHFGHFLTESTPRLWGLGPLKGQLDGLVFLHKRNDEVSNFHRAFLGLMGVDLPIRVVDKPTSVDLLHIPGQGFGLGRISIGTAAFRDFFRQSFAPDIKADGPERLYVSRSALGPRRGGALGEHFIEEHLSRHGYEVFHPQQHPLEVQIARYRAAKQIVALDGSALHLAAFACTAGQRVAMIRRRNSSMSNAIGLHLASFTGEKPQVIDAIVADWVLKERGGADRFSMGELDMPALQAQLQAHGFIAAEPAWPAIDPAWRDDQIARLHSEFGKEYIQKPRGAGKSGKGDA